MKNPITVLKNWLSGGKKYFQRAFVAAQINRLTSDWQSHTASIVADIRTQGKQLRNRARDLVQNNDIAKRYVNMVRTNVVGSNGFTFQNRAVKKDNTPDETINTEIENKFYDWCKAKNCSIDGRLSFRALQDLIMTYMPRDGEVFINIVTDISSKYGTRLQIIPPEYLDEQFNKDLGDGAFIRAGIQYAANGTPVAYWVRKPSTAAQIYGIVDESNFEPIPARDIIHLFVPEYSNQGRGYSWMAQSMLRMRMLSGYEDATLVNARVTAAKAVYFYSDNPDTIPQSFTGDIKDAAGNQLQSVEPGMVDMAPAGYKPYQLPAEYPSQQHEMFMRSTLRNIASGLNVSYNMLANDLVGVNYSSIRAGLLDEREMWKMIQQWFIEAFLDRVFERWLATAVMKSKTSFQMDEYDRVCQPQWFGRTWAWVDPLRDIEAKLLQVQSGFGTSNDVLAEQGKDIRETYRQLAEEKKLRAELGLVLEVDAAKKPAPAKPTNEKPTNDDDDDDLDETDRAMQIQRWFSIRNTAQRAIERMERTGNGNGNGHHK